MKVNLSELGNLLITLLFKKTFYLYSSIDLQMSEAALVVKNRPASAGGIRDVGSFFFFLKRCGFNPWVRKLPWRKAWKPTPVFLPGEFHGV